jgi:hypothetical protein
MFWGADNAGQVHYPVQFSCNKTQHYTRLNSDNIPASLIYEIKMVYISSSKLDAHLLAFLGHITEEKLGSSGADIGVERKRLNCKSQ